MDSNRDHFVGDNKKVATGDHSVDTDDKIKLTRTDTFAFEAKDWHKVKDVLDKAGVKWQNGSSPIDYVPIFDYVEWNINSSRRLTQAPSISFSILTADQVIEIFSDNQTSVDDNKTKVDERPTDQT
jgi:hypothetical protein